MKLIQAALFVLLAVSSARAECIDDYRCKTADGKVGFHAEISEGDETYVTVEATVDGKTWKLESANEYTDEKGWYWGRYIWDSSTTELPGSYVYSLSDSKLAGSPRPVALTVKAESVKWAKPRMKDGIERTTGTMAGTLVLKRVTQDLFPARKVAVSCKISNACD